MYRMYDKILKEINDPYFKTAEQKILDMMDENFIALVLGRETKYQD